ncbi:MAG: DEAD/DEAH box helicase [Chloroflexi bacterium]|nr:DEAD/DEAH box helicase [Chloroflexota bacterium]
MDQALNPKNLRREPRRWQIEALAAWSSQLRGVVSVVTGGGKTIFAMLCMVEVWRRYPNTRVLIVVPTVALMDQWRVALRDELTLDDSDIDLIGGGMRRIENSPIVLGVLDSMRTIASELTSTGQWFLIVDECHRAGSPTNRKVLDGSYVATLGLSATPERQYDDFFETVVSAKLGLIVYRYGYEEASHDGVISEFELWNLRVTPNDTEQKQLAADNRAIHMESQQLREIGLDTSKRLQNLLLRRSRHSQRVTSRLPSAVALVDSLRGHRGLVFHESIQSANEITAELTRRGHRVRAYHSQLGAPTRYLNLLLYMRGQIDVLVTCRALDEGIDVPESEYGIISASTTSVRQRIQRLGRVLRPHPDKKTATVVTIYVLPGEAETLRAESVRLEGVAGVRWFEAQ